MIKLYDSKETKFLNNGLGVIEPIKCVEEKNKSLNGWLVECTFPIKYKELIKQDMILLVETKEKGAQPFRCNNVEYTDRKITVTANHVVFDAERYMLADVRPTELSPVAFLNWINERTDITSPFFVTSNVSGSATRYFIRKNLLEAFEETEEIFGGSFDVDNFNVSLLAEVGDDDGFSIAYGKNLESVSVVEDWSDVATKILPTGVDGLTLPELYVYSEVQYEQPYTKVVDFDYDTTYINDEGEEVDYTTDEQIAILRELAEEYVKTSYIPKINYVVKSDVPQSLRIGDTVHVKHPILTIDTQVQSYTYDTITKRVQSLEFGNYERDVKKLFDGMKESIEEAKTNASGALELAEKQTEIINNLNKKGFVYIDDNEILILDKLPREEAQQVWRFGLGGIGFSDNGYLGPYNYALTQDGKFNADFIQANSITVNMLASDVGSSLDLSSNTSISSIVDNFEGQTSSLEQRIDSLESNISITGGDNLIKDSMGTYGDIWDGDYNVDSSVYVKQSNIYGFAILLKNSNLHQSVAVPNGTYTLSFRYCKHIALANVRMLVNGQETILSNTDWTNVTLNYEVTSGSIDITFISDTDNSCTILNLMLNQGSEKMVWSLNSNETWTDTLKTSSSGLIIDATGSDVLFNARADIIGFRNKNTNEYVAIFTDVGAEMNELIVNNKAKIVKLLFQEINGQTVINRLDGD